MGACLRGKTMDLRSAEVFVALAETLHFGQAATRCNLSSSAVSRQLVRLEEELGAPLMVRDKRHVAITPAGREVLQLARRWLAEWTQLSTELASGKGDLRGQLRVYASVTASYTVLAKVLPPLRKHYPGIELLLHTGDQADGVERVLAGQEDCAVVAEPDKLHPTLKFAPLRRSPLVLIGPADNGQLDREVRRQQKLGVEPDWSATPLVLAERGLARERLLAHFTHRLISPHVYAEVGGHEAVVSMVSLGFGVAVVPEIVISASPQKKSIKVLPWLSDLDDFVIGLCSKRELLQDPLMNAFWQSAVAEV